MSGWLNSLISNYIDSMVRAVEARLQISSPSRVFGRIGDNMAQGLGGAFVASMNGLKGDMLQAIPTDFSPAMRLGGFGGYGALAMAGAGGSNITNNLNFYTETVTPSDIARASRRASEEMLRNSRRGR